MKNTLYLLSSSSSAYKQTDHRLFPLFYLCWCSLLTSSSGRKKYLLLFYESIIKIYMMMKKNFLNFISRINAHPIFTNGYDEEEYYHWMDSDCGRMIIIDMISICFSSLKSLKQIMGISWGFESLFELFELPPYDVDVVH